MSLVREIRGSDVSPVCVYQQQQPDLLFMYFLEEASASATKSLNILVKRRAIIVGGLAPLKDKDESLCRFLFLYHFLRYWRSCIFHFRPSFRGILLFGLSSDVTLGVFSDEAKVPRQIQKMGANT